MRKKRKGRGSRIGSTFEREMCCLLSTWFCGEDDGLWRTSGSGARATVRAKKGKKTSNHCGDVGLSDERCKALLKVVAIELKKGYGPHPVSELFDAPNNHAQQEWEEWIEKAVRAQINSGSFAWWIITKRHRRETMIYMPRFLEDYLDMPWTPYIYFRVQVRTTSIEKYDPFEIVGTNLNAFLEHNKPDVFKHLAKEI